MYGRVGKGRQVRVVSGTIARGYIDSLGCAPTTRTCQKLSVERGFSFALIDGMDICLLLLLLIEARRYMYLCVCVPDNRVRCDVCSSVHAVVCTV